MKTVTITGGAVTLREAGDVSVRQRQAIEAASIDAVPAMSKIAQLQVDPEGLDFVAFAKAGITGADMALIHAFNAQTLVSLIVSWTFPEQIPKTVEEVLDLPAARYQELSEIIREAGLQVVVGTTSFEPGDPKAPGFTDRPTVASSDSGGGSSSVPVSPTAPATSA